MPAVPLVRIVSGAGLVLVATHCQHSTDHTMSGFKFKPPKQTFSTPTPPLSSETDGADVQEAPVEAAAPAVSAVCLASGSTSTRFTSDKSDLATVESCAVGCCKPGSLVTQDHTVVDFQQISFNGLSSIHQAPVRAGRHLKTDLGLYRKVLRRLYRRAPMRMNACILRSISLVSNC